jgi:predicted nucleic acid-binding protein
LLERYDNPHLSFFDCTSFVVARASEVDFVFGFDNDSNCRFDLRP